MEDNKTIDTKLEEKKSTVVKDDFILTDELRKKALEKPTFKILYVGDGDTRLSPFRGESMLKTFSNMYAKHAHIELHTASSNFMHSINLEMLKYYNVLWLDNISDFKTAKNLADLQAQLMQELVPNWDKELEALEGKEEESKEYVKFLDKTRISKLHVIYSLDEFIWDAPVGRSCDIQTVQLIETYIKISDSIIVPTVELKEAMTYYKFVPFNKDIYVIPSSVSVDFFPLFKNFMRKGKAEVAQLREKPNVLIKGLTVPKNIESFILENYKKMQITLCSIDEINDHIKFLLEKKKINHIYHWANPYVNKSNLLSTYALERDAGFDFVIHTKPDNMRGNMYEISTGDEDILFSIAYGAIPICGIDHLGYDENTKHLATISKKTFGKDTPSKKIANIIETLQTPVVFNEIFSKCKQEVEHRISNSPLIGARYFNIMLGKELSKARSLLAKEKRNEIEKEIKEKDNQEKDSQEKDSQENVNDVPNNIIKGNFNKG